MDTSTDSLSQLFGNNEEEEETLRKQGFSRIKDIRRYLVLALSSKETKVLDQVFYGWPPEHKKVAIRYEFKQVPEGKERVLYHQSGIERDSLQLERWIRSPHKEIPLDVLVNYLCKKISVENIMNIELQKQVISSSFDRSLEEIMTEIGMYILAE